MAGTTTRSAPKHMRLPGQANPLELVIITLLVLVGIGYSVISMSTGNFFWLAPSDFTSRPRAIEIYHGGDRTILSPGSTSYEALTAELNRQLNQVAGYYEYGMNDAALERALEDSTTVVFVYDDPLRFNTAWNLGSPNHLLVPITGSNSGDNKVYTGTDGRYGHGALILEDMSAFYALVQDDLGFAN